MPLYFLFLLGWIPHKRFRIDPKTIEHAVDKVEIGNTMHRVDDVFVRESMMSQFQHIFLGHGGR